MSHLYKVPDVFEIDYKEDSTLKWKMKDAYGKGTFTKYTTSKEVILTKYDLEFNQDICILDEKNNHSGFSIVVIQKGKFKHINSNNEIILNPQNTYLYFQNSNQTVNFFEKDQNLLVFTVTFSKKFIKEHFTKIENSNFMNKVISYYENCTSEFMELNFNLNNLFNNVLKSNNWSQEFIILAKAYKLLYVCIDYMEHDVKITSKEMKLLYSVQNYIENHLEQNLKVEDIVKNCGISESKIQRIFKVYSGKNVYEYIVEQKMKLASRLIRRGELNLKEISNKLGYYHQSNFSFAFKKHFGVNPKSFLKIDKK